jgi:hypothetical protein
LRAPTQQAVRHTLDQYVEHETERPDQYDAKQRNLHPEMLLPFEKPTSVSTPMVASHA